MAEIDKLLEKMIQSQAENAYLQSNEPLKIACQNRNMTGSILSEGQLRLLLDEITPADLQANLEYQHKITFIYSSPQGKFEFYIFKSTNTLTAYISPVHSGLSQSASMIEDKSFSSLPASQSLAPPVNNASYKKSGETFLDDDVIILDDSDFTGAYSDKSMHNTRINSPHEALANKNKHEEAPPLSIGCSVISIIVGWIILSGIWKQGGLSGKSDFAGLIIFMPLMLVGIWCLIAHLKKMLSD